MQTRYLQATAFVHSVIDAGRLIKSSYTLWRIIHILNTLLIYSFTGGFIHLLYTFFKNFFTVLFSVINRTTVKLHLLLGLYQPIFCDNVEQIIE